MRHECRFRMTENILGVERTEVCRLREANSRETRVRSRKSETVGRLG